MRNRFSSIHCWSNWLIWFNLDVNGFDENKTSHWHYKQKTTSTATANNILCARWTDRQTDSDAICFDVVPIVLLLLLLLLNVCLSNRGNWRSSFFLSIFLNVEIFFICSPYYLKMSARCMISKMRSHTTNSWMCSFNKSHFEEKGHRMESFK